MLTATLRNVGGSVMMAIPRTLLDGLGFTANTKVALRLNDGELIVAPLARPKYKLADLIAQCDINAPESAEEREWLDIPSIGKEIIE